MSTEHEGRPESPSRIVTMKSWHERCSQSCLFLCLIRQPFLRPDRALLLRRRAQTPSRSAVAQTTPQCPTSRGRTLDGGEHGGRLAWVGQKTIRRSGSAKSEPAMLSTPSQLCAHGCIVPSSRSGLLYNMGEWERERPSHAVTAAPSNCVNGLTRLFATPAHMPPPFDLRLDSAGLTIFEKELAHRNISPALRQVKRREVSDCCLPLTEASRFKQMAVHVRKIR